MKAILPALFCFLGTLSSAHASGWTDENYCLPVNGGPKEVVMTDQFDSTGKWLKSSIRIEGKTLPGAVTRVNRRWPGDPNKFTVTWENKTIRIVGYFVDGDARRNFNALLYKLPSTESTILSCFF